MFEEPAKHLHRGLGRFIEALGEETQGVMMGFIAARFSDTGAFLRSVESTFTQKVGASGYAKIAPTAVWPEHNRPTREWAETGRRRGVRLRKGSYIFRNTATRMRQMEMQSRAMPHILRELG
jgi:hypothetical protein